MIFKNNNKPTTKTIPSNGWLYHSPNSDSVIVFVHGFLSNTKDCWSTGNIFWPDLILSDNRLKSHDHSIYLAEFYTQINSGSYSITDCSQQVFSNLTLEDLTYLTSVLSKKNIIFVCHSLGGIIVRHLIDFNRNHFKNKKVGLVLMGSPSIGSKLADHPVLRKLTQIYRNTTAEQLSLTNHFLMDLDHRFRRLITQPNDFSIVGVEAMEHHPILQIKYLPDFMSPVVAQISSNRYFEAETIPDTNHSTIVKPDALNHPSHSFLLKFLTTHFCPAKGTEPKQKAKLSLNLENHDVIIGNVLFDVLNSRALPYYLTRAADQNIKNEHASRGIWIHGPSGTGKTSSIQNHLLSNKLKTINLCLSHMKGNFDSISFYNEILLTAKQIGEYSGEIPNQFPRQALIDFLSSQDHDSTLALYFDEIPFSAQSECMDAFINCISEIIQSVKLRAANSIVSIFFSSIESPVSAMMKCPKSYEQISLIDFSPWSPEDALNLIKLVYKHIPTLAISVAEENQLLRKAAGSPRVIKNFFRDKSRNSEWPFEKLLNSINTNEHAY